MGPNKPCTACGVRHPPHHPSLHPLGTTSHPPLAQPWQGRPAMHAMYYAVSATHPTTPLALYPWLKGRRGLGAVAPSLSRCTIAESISVAHTNPPMKGLILGIQVHFRGEFRLVVWQFKTNTNLTDPRGQRFNAGVKVGAGSRVYGQG